MPVIFILAPWKVLTNIHLQKSIRTRLEEYYKFENGWSSCCTKFTATRSNLYEPDSQNEEVQWSNLPGYYKLFSLAWLSNWWCPAWIKDIANRDMRKRDSSIQIKIKISQIGWWSHWNLPYKPQWQEFKNYLFDQCTREPKISNIYTSLPQIWIMGMEILPVQNKTEKRSNSIFARWGFDIRM